MTNTPTDDNDTPICKICLKNDADQTGSHITSAFLLASQIGKRGEEKSHIITTDPNQDYSVNTGDKEIKEDNIFCRDCEKRLSFIENIYSSEITNKIENSRYTENFPETHLGDIKYVTCNRINPIAFHLMVYTTLWRASIATNSIYQDFNLDGNIEEDLRFTIDLFLPNVVDHKIIQSTNAWNKMVENCQDLFNYFPYYILKAENLKDKSQTFEFYGNLSSDPYQIMLNEYIILPFFNQMLHSDDFFQVKKFTDVTLLNNKYRQPHIIIIPNDYFLSIIEMIRNMAVKQRFRKIAQECISEMIFNGEPIDPIRIQKAVQDRVNRINVEKPS